MQQNVSLKLEPWFQRIPKIMLLSIWLKIINFSTWNNKKIYEMRETLAGNTPSTVKQKIYSNYKNFG